MLFSTSRMERLAAALHEIRPFFRGEVLGHISVISWERVTSVKGRVGARTCHYISTKAAVTEVREGNFSSVYLSNNGNNMRLTVRIWILPARNGGILINLNKTKSLDLEITRCELLTFHISFWTGSCSSSTCWPKNSCCLRVALSTATSFDYSFRLCSSVVKSVAVTDWLFNW